MVHMEKEEMVEEEKKEEKEDVKEKPQQLDSRQLVELYKARMIDQLHQEVGGAGVLVVVVVVVVVCWWC